jgi:hypothetical protein
VIPPWLLGPLLKAGIVSLLILALIGIGEWHGRHAVQQAWDASITVQAVETSSELIERARRDASGVVRYITVTGAAQAKTKIVDREVIRYVASSAQKCAVSPEFEWAFDTISRLPSPSQDGVPTSTAAAGAPPESAGPLLTDAEVLRAYEAAIIQYRDLWLAYDALRRWVRENAEAAR